MPTQHWPSEPRGTGKQTPPPEQDAPPALLQQQEQARLVDFLTGLEQELAGCPAGEVFHRALELVRQAVGAGDAALVLVDERQQAQVWTAAGLDGAGAAAQSARRIVGRALAIWATQHWPGLLVSDALADPQWSGLPVVGSASHRSIVAAPLQARGTFRGILALTHSRPCFFSEFDLALVGAAATRLATAAEQAGPRPAAGRDGASMETAVVNLPDAVFAIDCSGIVTMTNPTLDRLVGRPASDLLGRPYRQAIDLEYPSEPFPIERVLQGEYTSFDMDMVLNSAAGEYIPVRVSCGAIAGQRGRPSGATVVLRDIRYLKEIEGLRQDLTHMLVHDLKGPLASISSAIQLLQQYPVERMGQETLQELLSIAERGSVRLSRMIEAVLDVQRLETGEFPLKRQRVQLREVVARVMAEAGPLVAEAGIDARIDVPADLPALAADGDVLERVLWNLLDNALKYTPRNGSILVAARTAVTPSGVGGQPALPADLPAGKWVVVDVADSGVGIPDDERERIFGKFAQGRRGPVRRRGVGLGLAFCRLAVEAHGGRIWVRSDRAQQGSVFSFVLPAERAVDALG